jgi:hypothetical protein
MYEKEYTEGVQFSKHGHAVTWQKKILIRSSQCNSNTTGWCSANPSDWWAFPAFHTMGPEKLSKPLIPIR